MSDQIENVFLEIHKDFEDMERKKEVDLTILEKINTVKEKFIEFENKSILNTNVDQGFPVFAVSKNCELILDTMYNRFSVAKSENDNPKVVQDSQPVMSIIYELYLKIMPIMKSNSTVMFEEMMNLLTILREMARMTRMLPSKQDEMKDINKAELGKGLREVGDAIEAKTIYGV